jgi:putative endonuclease
MFGFFIFTFYMYLVYILYSASKLKFYVGQTNDLDDRLKRHNNGESLSTKHGTPWILIYSIKFQSRSEAVSLESKIKKRGAKRYLNDIGFIYEV